MSEMEVETQNSSVELAEEAMEVDISNEETQLTVNEMEKKSTSPGSTVRNKLLLFKFESNKKSKKSLKNAPNSNEVAERDDDDVVDISNEVLLSDLKKDKRKSRSSNENGKTKKKKSLEKEEEQEVTLKDKEEAKENLKDSENVPKSEKENLKTGDSSSDKQESDTSAVESAKEKSVKTNVENSVKSSQTKPTKSPNPRKSKSNNSNKTPPVSASKSLLTMDKFIIRKKTMEEVQQEKEAKQIEKANIDNDEVMIIEDNEVFDQGKHSTIKESSGNCDIVVNKVKKIELVQKKVSNDNSQTKDIVKQTPDETKKTINEPSETTFEDQKEIQKSDIKEQSTTNNKKQSSSIEKSNRRSRKLSTGKSPSSYKPTVNSSQQSPSINQTKKSTKALTDSEKVLIEDKVISSVKTNKNSDKITDESVNSKNTKETSDENSKKESDAEETTDASKDATKEEESSKANCERNPTTPAAKKKVLQSNKTPKQRILEPKQLTPKQLEKQEEAVKRREDLARKKEEKEQEREKLRLEKEEKKKQEEEERKQKKLEEEEKKRKEREEKEEARRLEREAKEKVRKDLEEAKKKEKESKEQQRLAQLELRNKEKEARDEEKRKKELAEKEKKEKAAAAFASFFKPVATREVKMEVESAEPDVEATEKRLTFMPFQIKGDMRMAPAARTMFTPERSTQLDSAVKSEEAPSMEKLYLNEIKRESYVRGKGEKTWPADIEEEPDVIILESELCEENMNGEDSRGGFFNYPSKRVKRRAKLLQFHENRRPPYFGTWSKKTKLISGRNPFKQDEAIFEYDVDSADEWEEEGEGESLRGSEDEKEEDDEEGGDQYEVDNQMFVPHGYLSDEEEREDDDTNLDPEAHKMKLKLMELEFEEQMKRKTERLQPRLIGCVFLSNSGHYSTVNVGNHIRELLLTRRALYDESNIPITTTTDESNPVPQISSPTTSGDKETNAASTNERLTSIPDSDMPDLIRLIHGNCVNRQRLTKEFNTVAATQGKDFSRALISRTIREIAEYILCPLPECAPNTYPRKVWFVKPEIRDKFGLSDFLAYQNSWKFIVEPVTSEKKESAGGTPTTPREGRKNKEGRTPSSTQRRNRDNDPNTPTGTKKKSTNSTPSSDLSNEEKEMCSADVANASPHQVITKFTKVLSEEERLEQLNKTKVNTPKVSTTSASNGTSKTPKPMPKSKKMFRSLSRQERSQPDPNPDLRPSPTVRKRATLVTLAKTAGKQNRTITGSTKDKPASITNTEAEIVILDESSSGAESALKDAGTAGKDIFEGDTQKGERDSVYKENPEETVSPNVVNREAKTTSHKDDKLASNKRGSRRKSLPKTDEKAANPVGKLTPVTKAPGSGSIMDFITKERPKRKPDEKVVKEERKKIKLSEGNSEKEKNQVIECVDIESSNDGW